MDKRAKNQIVDSDIARLLLKLRKSRNLTVTELAQRSGVSQAMISKVERGTSSPSATILSRLANALNITLSKLLQSLRCNRIHLYFWLTSNNIGLMKKQALPAGLCPQRVHVRTNKS